MERKEISAKNLYDIIEPVTRVLVGNMPLESLSTQRMYRTFENEGEMKNYVNGVVSTLAIEGYNIDGIEEMIIDLLKERNKNPLKGLTIDYRPFNSKRIWCSKEWEKDYTQGDKNDR